MRPGADPRKCYIDGRVETLIERIEKLGDNLKTHNADMWKMLEERTCDIF